jgi:hypothetical protein
MKELQASVAEALARAHVAMLNDLRKLEKVASREGEEGLAELRACLGATYTHVTEHFRFEEQNGYMDVVRKREPRLERAILQVGEEHRRLTQSLEGLVADARVGIRLDPVFRERVWAWIEWIRQHEARENELVGEAFNLDLGAED